MGQRGGLAVYVTSHGFGHLNRSVAVINRMPRDVPVTIRSHPNLFDHWRERLRRPAVLEPHRLRRRGAEPAGRQRRDRRPATLELAAEVHAEAMARVDDEACRAPRRGDGGRPLRRAPRPAAWPPGGPGSPGFLLANFTWADIYAPHARRLGGDALRLVAELRRPYRQATALFRAEPALRLADVAPTDRGRHGRHPRPQPPARPCGSSWAWPPPTSWFTSTSGGTGRTNLGWERLELLGRKGIHFVGFHPAPVGPLPNLHVVPAGRVDRRRPGRLDRRDRGQGRLRHGLRGDGRRDAADLPAPDRLRRASRPRPGPAGLGRRHPGLGPRLRRPAPRAAAGPRLRSEARPAAVPGRRRGPRRRAPA